MARSILNRHRQQGFSILEAVFSALILSVALLALAGFHAVALQDGTLVKARSVAANLAQEKLDDLRSFTYLTDGDFSDDGSAASTTNYCGQGTFCFSEVATNAGGQEDSGGDLVMPSGTISGFIDNYSRTWTVECYNESTAAQLAMVDCADPDSDPTTDDIPNAKLVTVSVDWTDSKGGAQSLALQAMIYAMDPAMAARATVSPYPSQGPSVTYTPIGVPDAVPVPISTGDGKYKESSKPLPDVSSKGISLRTEFDAVSYTTIGGETTKDSQLEFATVNCVCEFAGSGSGYPASYFYWDAGKLKIKVPDATVTKMTGTAPSIQGDQQDSLCDTCCRDHHDSELPSAENPTTALYDPDRPSTDYMSATGNHKHYYYVNENSPALGLEAVPESSGNRYLEACRFARVDGFYRLLQDWRALDLVVMPKLDYLEEATPLANYQAYLVKYLKYQTQADCDDADGATGCSSINQSSAPAKSELSDRNLDNMSTGDQPQLMARAIYSDRVYEEDAPRTLDATYYTALATKVAASATWLDILPFNEVNVTLLASWHSSDATAVSVDNEKILSISATSADYYGVYYRGRAQVQSSGTDADIYAHLLPGNSGLTGGVTRDTYSSMVDYDASTLADTGTAISYASELGTDKHDHASSGRKNDSINIARTSSTPASTGSVRVGNSSVDLATVQVVEAGGMGTTQCTVTYTAGDNSGSFACSHGYTGNAQISQVSGTGYFYSNALDADSNGSFDASIDGGSYTDLNSCATGDCGNFWVFGPTITVSGKCWGNQCANSTFAYKTTSPTEGTDTACVLSTADNATVSCTVTLDTTAHTWTGKIKITGNGSNYVLADADTCDSTAGTSAKYTAADILAGPADKQSAFDVCATDVVALPTTPSTPTGLGLSIVSGNASFSWGNVTNESGYKVYYCQVNGNSSCSPNTLGAAVDVNVTSASLTAPGNNKTRCYNVVAFNAGGDSAASQSMCVYLFGGTYTYSGPF